MIHWHPGWLGSRFNVIIINISVKAYGENEWGLSFMNAEVPADYYAQLHMSFQEEGWFTRL